MKDFLRGMIGRLLQIVLGLASFICFIAGFVSCGNQHVGTGSVLIVVAILCLSAIFRIRYWLGHVVRMK